MDKNKLAEEYAEWHVVSTEIEKRVVSHYLAGFDAALAELSKSGEFREFWILNPIHDKPMVWSKEPKWVNDTIHTIEVAALQQANAKIQELEQQLKRADEVMRSMHIDTMAWNIKTTDKEVLSGWHESNNEAIEKYLKSRGE